MDSVAIDVNRKAFLRRPLAETFHQDEDSWRLFFIESGIVAHDDIVEDDVDVRDFMAVEGCDEGIRLCIQIALGHHELNDIADLDRLFLISAELVFLLCLNFLWLRINTAFSHDLKRRGTATLRSNVVLFLRLEKVILMCLVLEVCVDDLFCISLSTVFLDWYLVSRSFIFYGATVGVHIKSRASILWIGGVTVLCIFLRDINLVSAFKSVLLVLP